jgi:hypothetical protein
MNTNTVVYFLSRDIHLSRKIVSSATQHFNIEPFVDQVLS